MEEKVYKSQNIADRTPAYHKTVGILKDRYDNYVAMGDVESANSMVRQMEMLNEAPDNFVTPRDKSYELEKGAVKGSKAYWGSKYDMLQNTLPFLPEENPYGNMEELTEPSESGVEMGGEVLGSLLANPVEFGKGVAKNVAYNMFEGYTAPTANADDRTMNALVGGGVAGGLNVAGKTANMFGGFGAQNPNLKEAVKFASKNKLPKPFVDEYSKNPMARMLGWYADNPLVMGSMRKAERTGRLEGYAVKQAKKRKAPEFTVKSVVKQYGDDIFDSDLNYERAFDVFGRGVNVDASKFMPEIQSIIDNVARLGGNAPKKIMNKLKALSKTQDGDIEHWHEVRSLLRDTAHSMSKKGSVGRQYINTALSRLDNMILDSAPNEKARKLLQRADDFYSENIPKYKELTELTDAIRKGDSTKIVNFLTEGSNRSGVKGNQLWNSIDDEGRNAIRGQVFTRAKEFATDNAGMFDPQKYADYFNKFGERSGIVFEKADQDMISGITKLFGMSKSGHSGGSNWIQSKAIAPIFAGGAFAGGSMFIPEEYSAAMGAAAFIPLLTRLPAGGALLRGLGKAQDAGEWIGAMRKIGLLVSRNPEVLRGTGVTPESWDKATTEFKEHAQAKAAEAGKAKIDNLVKEPPPDYIDKQDLAGYEGSRPVEQQQDATLDRVELKDNSGLSDYNDRLNTKRIIRRREELAREREEMRTVR